MLAQTQLPVSVFRFAKVYSADQIMATHEFMVDHLLNTLQGQNWVMHWNPAQDYTECQILFPFVPDRVTHIRPIANYFQQHLMDPAIMYRPRSEFIELVRSFDVNRCLEFGGWGLTTMTRLNNIFGKVITETRTKIMSPTEVTYKYITREIPALGQSLVSPLARGVSPMAAAMCGTEAMMACDNMGMGMGHNMLAQNMNMNMLGPLGMPSTMGRFNTIGMHTLRGLKNMVEQNLLGSLNYSPIGLSAPIGLGLEQQRMCPASVEVEHVEVQQPAGLQQGLGYGQHIPLGPLGARAMMASAMNPMAAMTPMGQLGMGMGSMGSPLQAHINPAQVIASGLNNAVCQTLNPALCEQQVPVAIKVTKAC